jgi:SAM-dependent methyltransferase
MSEHQALSFGGVVDAYDQGRPSYPVDAVDWLVGDHDGTVLELGAGTGKFTRLLVENGHQVLATDPDPRMVQRLRDRVPGARAAVAMAEEIPMPSRVADVVVCAQSFHWFDHPLALREIARVLRPGGHLALVWNQRDEGIPWVRKLGRLVGSGSQGDVAAQPLVETEHFGWVEEKQFRFWQTHTRDSLLDLVRSRSQSAVMSEQQRELLLDRVCDLYDDYGRGPDGMRLPYLTRCYRAVVRHQEPAPPVTPVAPVAPAAPERPVAPPEDPGTLLIDFR